MLVIQYLTRIDELMNGSDAAASQSQLVEKGVNELHHWGNGIDKFPIVTQRFIIDVGPLQLKTSWNLSACLGSVWIGVDKVNRKKKHGGVEKKS